MPDTEAIDKLFLELSQFSKATTKREIDLLAEMALLRDNLKKQIVTLKQVNDYLQRWHPTAHKAVIPMSQWAISEGETLMMLYQMDEKG